ncbi:uncharacterized protein LOC143363537 [Halictus rubicundus]|uniref:uncharacterized protein LOC143363537 n=1 Tax=Halictus rubicundus TaxID=77578 RepID=UPI004036B18D
MRKIDLLVGDSGTWADHPGAEVIPASNDSGETSDGGTASGSARSLRPRRPRQGATGDNLTTSPVMILVLTPFQARSCKVCAQGGRGNIYFLRLADELRHYEEAHQRSSLTFRCRDCNEEFDRRHAADCHRPRCPGVPPAEEGQQCAHCKLRFSTRIGMSQHLRHRHPAASNEARRLAAEVPTSSYNARSNKIGTAEEEHMLAELEEKFKHKRFIAKAISEVLTSKTTKQIRDKRTDIRRKMERQRIRLATQHTSPIPAEDVDAQDGSESDNEEWADPADRPPTPSPANEALAGERDDSPATAEENGDFDRWTQSVIDEALAGEIDEGCSQEDSEFRTQIDDLLRAARTTLANITQVDIDKTYDLMISSLPAGNRKRGRAKRRGKGKRAYRRYLFAKTQDLYHKNPGLLAKFVRNGTDHWVQGELPLQVEDIKQIDLIAPISNRDVRGRIAKTKKGTAPGLDGIKKDQLLSRRTVVSLRKLFNLLLITGLQPSSWKKNRTILIPKEGKDSSLCENYRPLTISSLLSRIYWGIIDTRLRTQIRCTPRQKGFTSEMGCYNNVHILSELLAHSKVQGGLVAVQLDVAKAFDTIPHDILGPALHRKGATRACGTARLPSLSGCAHQHTLRWVDYPNLSPAGGQTGRPLSPLLFNLALEPLLLTLEKQAGYMINEEQNISCLAFADDLILVASDVPQARNLLSLTESYLAALGMRISAPKCTAFQIVPMKGSFYLKDPELRFQGGECIPFANAETRIRYLGISFTPWSGIVLDDLRDEVKKAVNRVKRLALKPHQKINLLSTYLVPHYLYRLITGVAPNILHLPTCTTNGLIYARKCNGVLGFPKLEITCVSSSLKAGLLFLNNPDPAIQCLARATGLENKLKNQAKASRINWPIASPQLVDKWKAEAKERELNHWGDSAAPNRHRREQGCDESGHPSYGYELSEMPSCPRDARAHPGPLHHNKGRPYPPP